jgi:chaperonin GroES
MRQLLSYIDNPNIAEDVSEDRLKKIGEKVCEDYGKDRDSMSDWSKAVDRGMRIAKPADAPKSFPWDGASNYKSSLIYEAVISFGDRVASEILSEKALVKGCLTGVESEEKNMRMTRVAKFMNWQFNYEMKEWRDEQEQALYALAACGAFFKKTFFDPTEGKNVSYPIFYPNFAVNQNEKSMSAMTRFTECKNYTDNEIEERIRAGIWIDQDYNQNDDDKDNEDGDEAGKQEITDNFIEQCTSIDLDDDGYAEPYIVTVHKQSGMVARIVARFDKSSILVKVQDGVVAPLNQIEPQIRQQVAQEKLQEVLQMQPEDAETMTEDKLMSEVDDAVYGKMQIVKIKPTGLITKYGFVVAPDGTFLNWGYCHLLASQSELINTTTNQLIDAGSLANLPSGYKSKEFRQNKTPMRMKPGEITQVDVPADVLKNGLLFNQFREPSAGLMQLNEMTKAEARNMTAIVNLEGTIAPNAPAATTLGILQEKMMPTTTLIGRVLRSMSEEFSKMFDLNAKYTDPQLYQQVLDDPQADYQQDFTRQGYDIEPTADASKSSQMQQMQTATVLLELLPIFDAPTPAKIAIAERVLNTIGETELLPKLLQQPQQDPQMMAMEQERLQVEQMNMQLQQQNNDLLTKQHEIKMAELEINRMKLQLDQQELQRKLKEGNDNLAVQVAKLESEAERNQADAGLKNAQEIKTLAEAAQIGREPEREEM